MEYKNIEWKEYLIRTTEYFFTSSLVTRFKGQALYDATGFGYFSWLIANNGSEIIKLYYNKEDVFRSNEKVLELLRDAERVKELFEKGKEVLSEVERVIRHYKKKPVVVLRGEFIQIVDLLIRYFVYAVEIPYCLGSTIEKEQAEEKHADILEICTWFRAQSHYPTYSEVVLEKIFQAICEQVNRKREDLQLLAYEEMLGLLDNSNIPNREKGFLYVWQEGKGEFVEDKDFREQFFENVKEQNILHGKTAQKGAVTGRACVVLTTKDFSKFKEGNIIVTIQSNPSFMPILRKCSGIIADEGGIMSHASIVSRELRKPCIIGTKIGTQVLKDGDVVELDATKGMAYISK